MSGIVKIIRRCIGILSLSTLFILLLNIALLMSVSARMATNAGPWTTAEETAQELRKQGKRYVLSKEQANQLRAEHVWAVLIDNQTLAVQWHTDGLPQEVPLSYTACEIAGLTRGYIGGYPTFTAESDSGLVVLGYPKDRYWKHMFPSWDYQFIKNAPYLALTVVGVNLAAIFLIYVLANARFLKSACPIAEGIEALPLGGIVEVKEQGILSGIALKINETSRMMQVQRRELARKETARANWISGVSHDIRTPLSMVMGYAGQLAESAALPAEDRKKAEIICAQSIRMKNLINDLNLASKLEYNMQPLSKEQVSLSALARQSAADFINSDPKETYPVALEVCCDAASDRIRGDKALLLRALRNLLENARIHNPAGCRIQLTVHCTANGKRLTVEDDGVGISEEKLENLRHTPHYMMHDAGTGEPRHGLGLLIVQQIAAAHGGKVVFGHGKQGGFLAEMVFGDVHEDRKR
ncbi:MAG: HAMP domain-containing histidine kinase [Eubacterium sp.]|nr:HAMP domain-containing histidine kinase [Eubacterium sp.]